MGLASTEHPVLLRSKSDSLGLEDNLSISEQSFTSTLPESDVKTAEIALPVSLEADISNRQRDTTSKLSRSFSSHISSDRLSFVVAASYKNAKVRASKWVSNLV